MTENERFEFIGLDNEVIKDNVTGESHWVVEYKQRKRILDLLNEQDERIETLKEDVEIILDYVLNKGKFAMTVKEQKAHNRLRDFVRGDVE